MDIEEMLEGNLGKARVKASNLKKISLETNNRRAKVHNWQGTPTFLEEVMRMT